MEKSNFPMRYKKKSYIILHFHKPLIQDFNVKPHWSIISSVSGLTILKIIINFDKEFKTVYNKIYCFD